MMLTLYARRMMTTDPAINYFAPWVNMSKSGIRRKYSDVILYDDPLAQEVYCRFRWDAKGKPDRRNKTVTINSFTYDLEWLPDRPWPTGRDGGYTLDDILLEVKWQKTANLKSQVAFLREIE